jgi:endonuclease-8
MPEGDTLHKIADFLAPRLEGCRLEEVALQGRKSRLSGEVVRSIEAMGKHLLIEMDNGIVLRSHLGMHGSWHRYGLNESWRKPPYKASIVLRTETELYVCFNAKSVDCIEARKLKFHPVLGNLGPDLLADDVDLDAVILRARETMESHHIISDVLLNQKVASGIGNVYKNEVLFLHRLHPETPLARIDDEALRSVFETAQRLMRENLGGGARRTIQTSKQVPAGPGAPRYWVYGRMGNPCLKCGSTIRCRRLGAIPRATYWCPQCQRY